MSELHNVIIYRKVRGIVSWFNYVKRFGFIMSDVGDVFVHKNNLVNRSTLRTGQMVEFDVHNAPRGLQALNVNVVTEDSPSGPAQDSDTEDEDLWLSGNVIMGYNVSPQRNRSPVPPPRQPPTRQPPPPPRQPLSRQPPPPPPPTYKQETRSPSKVEEEDKTGFDTTRFEGDIPDELICSICQGVLNDPVQTVCEHLFCRCCIEEWLRHQRVCPLDREPLHHKPISGVPRYLKRMLGALKLHCTFVDKGCKSVVTLDELDNHLKVCPHAKPKIPAKSPASTKFRSVTCDYCRNAASRGSPQSSPRPNSTREHVSRTPGATGTRGLSSALPLRRRYYDDDDHDHDYSSHGIPARFYNDSGTPVHNGRPRGSPERNALYPSLDNLTDSFHYSEQFDNSPPHQILYHHQARQNDSCSVM